MPPPPPSWPPPTLANAALKHCDNCLFILKRLWLRPSDSSFQTFGRTSWTEVLPCAWLPAGLQDTDKLGHATMPRAGFKSTNTFFER